VQRRVAVLVLQVAVRARLKQQPHKVRPPQRGCKVQRALPPLVHHLAEDLAPARQHGAQHLDVALGVQVGVGAWVWVRVGVGVWLWGWG